MSGFVSVAARSHAVVLIVASGLVLGAHEAHGCQAINDFVKDIENGKSWMLMDADVTLVDVAKNHNRTVRRYSVRLPPSVPSEIMQLETIDDDHAKPWHEKLGTRHLRIRPHSVSHWIDVSPNAVTTDIYDVIHPCPQTKSEQCSGFGIHFESRDGSLEVGFLSYPKDDKLHIDQVTLTVRERWCTTSDMFRK